MKTQKILVQKNSRQPALCGLLIAGAALLGTGVQRCAAAFTSTQGALPNDELTTSYGAFQIQVDPNFTNLFYPTTPLGFFYFGFSPANGTLTSPVGYDGATRIGVSANHNYVGVGGTAPNYPVTIGGPLLATLPVPAGYNQITSMNNYYGVPNDVTTPNDPFVFPFPITGPDEVFTEIESFQLLVSSGAYTCGDQRVPGVPGSISFDILRAGPNAGPGPAPAGVTDPLLRSIGKVQQYSAGDSPAASFFDIYVNAFLPSIAGTFTDTAFPGSTFNPTPPPWAGGYPYAFGMAILTNSWDNPLIIEDTNVTTLPPHVVYIHGQTPAVPIAFKYNNPPYWNAGDILGYITLAGHGVLQCTNSDNLPGDPSSNCCSTVAQLLDATFGPVGSPKAGMPVPWPRGVNSLPTPNTTLKSLVNTFVDSSSGTPTTNVLDDAVGFPFNANTVATISGLVLGALSNSVAPPAVNSTATYNGTNVPVSFLISFNGATPISCTGTSSVAMVFSNTGVASTKIYYPNGSPGLTTYGVQLLTLNARCTSGAGPFFLRVDQSFTNRSWGEATIRTVGGGYRVSFYDDAHFQLGTDGVNYLGALSNRTMRLGPSLPAATKATGMAVVVPDKGHFVISWIGQATLQSATSLIGSNIWTSVTGSTVGPVTNTIGPGVKFFRLKIP